MLAGTAGVRSGEGVLPKGERGSAVGRTIVRVASVGAVTAAGLIFGAAAYADHFENMYPTSRYNPACQDGELGDPFCRQDNDYVTVWRKSSLSSDGKRNIALTLNSHYVETDLTIDFQTSDQVETSGSTETDIMYEEGTVPDGFNGFAWCNDSITQDGENRRCDQHYARFASATPSVELACHETGHTVGLTHGNVADPDAGVSVDNHTDSLKCMTTQPIEFGYVGPHNHDEINETY